MATESQLGIDRAETNCKIPQLPPALNVIDVSYVLRNRNLFEIDADSSEKYIGYESMCIYAAQ